MSGVMPTPPAAFSPFTIVNKGSYVCLSLGIPSETICRPGFPTTSPRNSIRYWSGSGGLITDLAGYSMHDLRRAARASGIFVVVIKEALDLLLPETLGKEESRDFGT